MLSINDQIVEMAVPRLGSQALRVSASRATSPRRSCRRSWPGSAREIPHIRFIVRSEHFDIMSRDLRQGELDLMIGLSEAGIVLDARHQWTEPMVWVRAAGLRTRSRSAGAARHVRRGMCHSSCGGRGPQQGAATLRGGVHRIERGQHHGCGERRARGQRDGAQSRASHRHRDLGKSAACRRSAMLYCGIYLGETGDRPVLEELADAIFDEIGPKPSDLRAFTSALMTGAIGQILSAGSRRRSSSARSPSAAPSRSCAAPAPPSPSTSRCRAPRARAGPRRSAAR